jgi:hypothetical protein
LEESQKLLLEWTVSSVSLLNVDSNQMEWQEPPTASEWKCVPGVSLPGAWGGQEAGHLGATY